MFLKTKHRNGLLTLFLACVQACATWNVQREPPAVVLTEERKDVRLTLVDGSQHALSVALVEGDSVVGVRVRPAPGRRNTVAFALADVQRVEIAEYSHKPLWIGIGVLAGIFLGGFFLLGAMGVN
jgi:hypothetical protein